MSDPKKKQNKKRISFEAISGKFGTPEAEKITLFLAIFQLFSSYRLQESFVKLANWYASHRNGGRHQQNVYLLKNCGQIFWRWKSGHL